GGGDGRHGVLVRHPAVGRQATDAVGELQADPQGAVRPEGEAARVAAGGRQRELGEAAVHGEAADLVPGAVLALPARQREPERPVRPGDELERAAAGGQGELGDGQRRPHRLRNLAAKGGPNLRRHNLMASYLTCNPRLASSSSTSRWLRW